MALSGIVLGIHRVVLGDFRIVLILQERWVDDNRELFLWFAESLLPTRDCLLATTWRLG